MKSRALLAVAGFSLGLLVVGGLRLQAGGTGVLASLSGFATPLYVTVTVIAAFSFRRLGVPLNGFGFRTPLSSLAVLALALIGVGCLQISGAFLGPVWERVFGSERDLTRFAEVGGSMSELMAVLALSWTFAAFGEEFAFRILLMRGIAFSLGDSRFAFVLALLLQALIFGLVHAYQGPVGIAGTMSSALIFGALIWAARGTIWPAALAHGLNNTIGLLQLYLAG
jgi:membrane protease YdiL (CAAX protease family)